MKLLAVITFVTLFIVLEGNGQSFYNFGQQRTLTVSAGIGNASYFGELNNPGEYLDAKLNLTAGLQYMMGPRFSARADLTWFQLAGDDSKSDSQARLVRNLSFRSGNVELAFTGSFSFLETPVRFDQRPIINGYAFGGFGVLYTNPTAEYLGQRYPLQPLKTENQNYSRFQIVVPFGLGARIRVSQFMNIIVEGGYRKTFTDYLDDVSTVHQDKSSWTDPVRIALSDRKPELGLSPYEPGSIRGDAANKDGYLLLSIKGEYYLPQNFLAKNNQRKLYNRKRKSYYRRR